MTTFIKDGTGKGYQAGVTAENRLLTASVGEVESKHNSVLGTSFQLTNNAVPVVGSTDQLVTWFAHTDPNRLFYINRFFISWNGGSTTYNKPLTVNLYFGTPVPTANHVAATPSNQNFTSQQTALATYYLWNKTSGTGMTVASVGLLAQTTHYSQGMNVVNVDGTLILRKDLVMAVGVNAPEAGVYTGLITGWFA
jgi:hypothetical protein